MNNFENKHLLSVRLIPSILLSLVSLSYSFSYLDTRYATLFHYLQAGGFFGISILLLFIDIGVECFYKKKDLIYNVISVIISTTQAIYFAFAIGTYFKQLPIEEDPGKRLFPILLLTLLLLANIAYRVLTWLNKWKTDESKGNDLLAAYIGFFGLGIALLNSFPFAVVQIHAEDLVMGYVGVVSDIALGAGILEALTGLLWLSWDKLRKSSKSNIFFYLTVLNQFASLAGIVVAAFAYPYGLMNLQVSIWFFSFYGISSILVANGLFYLNHLLKK